LLPRLRYSPYATIETSAVTRTIQSRVLIDTLP
jgi:hypothetical protein